jgi:hypothetical protein
MSVFRKPPLRRFIAFSQAQARFEELAEHVVKLDLELILEREGGEDVALIDAGRLTYYQALEASLPLEGAVGYDGANVRREARGVPNARDEQFPVAMNFYVASTNESPREVLERYRVECDLPTQEGPFDLSARVADELSRETFLASLAGFDPGQLSLPAVMLRAYCLARFGTPELPPAVEDYKADFNQIVISVVARKPIWPPLRAPLFLLSLGPAKDRWKVSYAMRSSESDFFWQLDASLTNDPLHLVWNTVHEIKVPPAYLDLAYAYC